MKKVGLRIYLCLALLAAPTAAFAHASAAILENIDNSFNQFESVDSGRASVELGRGGTYDPGQFSFSAVSYADTKFGSLGGAITANNVGAPSNGGLSLRTFSQFTESLMFSHSGDVLFRMTVQGSFASPPGGATMSSNAILSVDSVPNRAAASWGGGVGFFSLNSHLLREGMIVSALPSNYIVWVDRLVHVIAGIPIPIHAELDIRASPPPTGDVRVLFDHTAQLAIFTPGDMTYTSPNGFMSAAVTAVPEPETYAMLLAGIGLVGFMVRRKRRA